MSEFKKHYAKNDNFLKMVENMIQLPVVENETYRAFIMSLKTFLQENKKVKQEYIVQKDSLLPKNQNEVMQRKNENKKPESKNILFSAWNSFKNLSLVKKVSAVIGVTAILGTAFYSLFKKKLVKK